MEASLPRIVQIAISAAPRLPLFQRRSWWDKPTPKLDLNALPDHLKRDLGFMGGRTSPARDPLRD